MSNLSAQDAAAVEAALESDPERAAALGPLLAGEYGIPARDLVLCALAERLGRGFSLRAALIPALAQALHIARAGADFRWHFGRRLR